ncbi:hypothetical protein ACIOGT_25310 [Streptomyces microflavus]|uniref:hypothetical protein n=1 Tax=Streptomyces microflavus TaxID=1919 RepID=UPI0037F54C1C
MEVPDAFVVGTGVGVNLPEGVNSMANLRKSCGAVAAAAGICAGVLGAAPAGAQAQDPVYRVIRTQTLDRPFLAGQEDNLFLNNEGTPEAWVLHVPQGAPQGVYQIQRSGTGNCIKAMSKYEVKLVPCAKNPGKPQRWALDITPGSLKTIESRQYPKAFLSHLGEDVNLQEVTEPSEFEMWEISTP